MGLAVHEDARPKGVARAPLEHVATIAAKAGTRLLRLSTVAETGNVEVFERLGFRTVSEKEDDLVESDAWEVLTDVTMKRPL
jgi:GNAT superfamily N-acetyltransferase